MGATIRNGRKGRHIPILDGCSDRWGGATMQGAVVCRISLPAEVAPVRDAHGLLWFNEPAHPGVYSSPADIAIAAHRGEIPGARVYEFRRIQ